jgi:heterodisulfide reductase subunit A
VDVDKCIACGLCAQKCPKRVDDEYNESLVKRKAIYVPYSQAVPLKYAIDPQNCIYLNKGKCGVCETLCPSGAINFKDTQKTLQVQVGSLILASGFKSFDPSASGQLWLQTACRMW